LLVLRRRKWLVCAAAPDSAQRQRHATTQGDGVAVAVRAHRPRAHLRRRAVHRMLMLHRTRLPHRPLLLLVLGQLLWLLR
jgi:hypothetical protein